MNDNTFIIPFEDVDREEWNGFISGNPAATYFSSTDYYRSFRQVYFVISRDGEGSLYAGLPLILRTPIPAAGFLFRICSIESAVMTRGGLSENESREAKRIIINKMMRFLKSRGVVYCYISHWIRSADSDILTESGFRVKEEATVEIDLSPEEKLITGNFKAGFRHALNKARRLGVSYDIREGKEAETLLGDLASLRRETQKKAKRRNPNASMMLKTIEFTRNILLSENNKVYIATASYGGRIAHIVMFVSFGKVLYAYLSGSDVRLNSETGAANFLYYNTILFAKKQGFRCLDMGGTPLNPLPDHPAYGVWFFKRSFGGNTRIYIGGSAVIRKIRGYLVLKLLEDRQIVRFLSSLFKL